MKLSNFKCFNAFQSRFSSWKFKRYMFIRSEKNKTSKNSSMDFCKQARIKNLDCYLYFIIIIQNNSLFMKLALPRQVGFFAILLIKLLFNSVCEWVYPGKTCCPHPVGFPRESIHHVFRQSTLQLRAPVLGHCFQNFHLR